MSTLLIKQLKPKTLRIDAFRLHFLNELRKAGRDIIKDFEKTTATWKKKPRFEMQISLSGGLQVEVFTESELYGWIDKGTNVGKPPYPIFAGFFTGKSDKKALAFSSNFSPKTVPGVIGSSAGAVGTVDTVRPFVEHPGIKPREFTKEIQEQWETKFKRRMEKALKQARLASGHAI